MTYFMKKNVFIVVISLLFLTFAFIKCNEEPKIVTKTTVKYIDRVDTITKVDIQEVPKIVFVNKYKTVKGKDSVVYVKLPNDSTIKANQYQTTLKSNNAEADLSITTTGQLLDVSGIIRYKEKETTTNTTITRAKSGLFLYSGTSINPMLERVEVGVDWVIKNKIIIGVSASYNDIAKQSYINGKIGFRL